MSTLEEISLLDRLPKDEIASIKEAGEKYENIKAIYNQR